MARKNPLQSQRDRLIKANADRCCVCKRPKIGLHLHHIDGDSSNTVDDNLAVLCVEDHDRHHRPSQYKRVRHLDLGPEAIIDHKRSWEAFVAEAQKEAPGVVAVLTAYGTVDQAHSFQLVMHWPDQRIECKRFFHLAEVNVEILTDEIVEEVHSIGVRLPLIVISEPLPIEHCPCCGNGYCRTLAPAMILRYTDPHWQTDSLASIYVNPDKPSLAIEVALRDQHLLSGSLHICEGRFLHYIDEYREDRIELRKSPSVRTQVSSLVNKVLGEWRPAEVFFGTGDPDNPLLIDDLELPQCWEHRASRRAGKR
ncbi:HNH endonuclease [Ensifer sp. NBAIM29]|nr:HNH endonuclease [Ensifer sp. NBAIM29]